MSNGSTADYLVDRRRLRARVTFWRAAAFLVLILAALGGAALLAGRSGLGTLTPHIARLAIGGVITGDEGTLALLKRVEASNAAALILTIESPGGTTTGAEKLYEEIRRVAAKKPVVAVVGTLAASGGYIAALGADRIVAQGNSLVGSIGVLFEFPNVSGLLDKLGVKVETVKSSPLKAVPNGFEPTSDAARAVLASLVADSFDWFKGLVKGPSRPDRRRTRRRRRRAGVHRAPGARQQTGRRTRRRARGGGLARSQARRRQGPADPHLRPDVTLRAPWSVRPSRRARARVGVDRRRGLGGGGRAGGERPSRLTGWSPFGTLKPRDDGRAPRFQQGVPCALDVPMIKSELVLKIAERNPHLYQRDVENIVNAILDEITNALSRGDRVELRGFGAFSVKRRDPRQGRNPRTGEQVAVDGKAVPFFKTGKEMRERLNQDAEG